MKKQELSNIRQEVDNAFSKVFSGNNRLNEGCIENHCDEKTLDYFNGLYEGKESALERKKEILNKAKSLDMSNIETNITKIINE